MAFGTFTNTRNQAVVELFVETCCNCGTPFGVESTLHTSHTQNHGKTFYCPNGHAQSYVGKTDAEKERDRTLAAQAEADRIRAERDRWMSRASMHQRSSRAYKGQVTKLKKRYASGICPCCTRSFSDLYMHMTTEHPTFLSDDTAPRADSSVTFGGGK